MTDNRPSQKSEIVKTTLFEPTLYGGRFTRKQFWCYSLLGVFFASAVEFLLGDSLLGSAILLLYSIFYTLPITVKRCHDIGETGFMLLPFITPSVCFSFFAFFIAAIAFSNLNSIDAAIDAAMPIIVISGVFSAIFNFALLLKLGFEDSQKGTNQYGPSIKYPGPAENYEENKQVSEVKNNSSTDEEMSVAETATVVAKGVAQVYANWVWDNIKLYIIPFLGIDWFEHKKVIMGIIHIIICLVVALCVGMAIDGALYAIIAPWVSGIALSLICNMYHND